MAMPSVHKPTLATAVIIIVVLFVVYHFMFRKK